MNVDAIFDAFIEASARVCLEDERDCKAEQLRSVQAKRCGNCCHWMKTSCVPEKQRGEFKGINSPACSAFVLNDSRGLIAKFEGELAAIEARLKS